MPRDARFRQKISRKPYSFGSALELDGTCRGGATGPVDCPGTYIASLARAAESPAGSTDRADCGGVPRCPFGQRRSGRIRSGAGWGPDRIANCTRGTDLVQKVTDETKTAGADVVFEVSGSAAGTETLTRLPRTRGRIVVVAIFSQPPTLLVVRHSLPTERPRSRPASNNG
jgi:hypothetical protein